MSYNFYEIHEAEYEAMTAYLRDLQEQTEQDADWEASGGHLWD